ncbi:glycosyltransferase family 2 protein, partial [Streptococcus suis]
YLKVSTLTYQDYQAAFVTLQNKPMVSIIIPIGEESPDLQACLESISEQTYRELEILLVQNKAYSHSQALMDAYQKDSRFHLLTLDTEVVS